MDTQSYTLPSAKFPKMSTAGRHYSFDEIKKLNEYAAVRGIELIPEIEFPGHSKSMVTAYPELFGNTPDGERVEDTYSLDTYSESRKVSQVLLDAETGRPLCVVDLDTVMPGLSLYDYGDSIRFGASTAAEDEQDLSLVTVSLEHFRMYTRGFLEACPNLTPLEIEMLPMGAKTMTMECGVRFLSDYLDGDHYFSTHYAGQNLDRCRTQFKLVADMEAKWEAMKAIVQEEADRRNQA